MEIMWAESDWDLFVHQPAQSKTLQRRKIGGVSEWRM
jgi:hypothetical protein